MPKKFCNLAFVQRMHTIFLFLVTFVLAQFSGTLRVKTTCFLFFATQQDEGNISVGESFVLRMPCRNKNKNVC